MNLEKNKLYQTKFVSKSETRVFEIATNDILMFIDESDTYSMRTISNTLKNFRNFRFLNLTKRKYISLPPSIVNSLIEEI